MVDDLTIRLESRVHLRAVIQKPVLEFPEIVRASRLAFAITLLSVLGCSSDSPHGDGECSLAWRQCPDSNEECACLRVPVDYEDPHGDKVDLWAMRRLATHPSDRIGVLFPLQGGPGVGTIESSIGVLAAFGSIAPELLERFDLIFIDRRGTGLSGPVSCGSDAVIDAIRHLRTRPANASEWAAVESAWTEYGESCGAAASPEYLRSLSTEVFARDLDEWRTALGENTVNLVGFSYGTTAVSAYATLFPDHLRAGVEDAAQRPADDVLSWLVRIGNAADVHLEDFFATCGTDASCTFHGGEGVMEVEDFYSALETRLLTTSGIMAGTWQVGIGDLGESVFQQVRNSNAQELSSMAAALSSAESGDWDDIVAGAGGTGGGYDLAHTLGFYGTLLADMPCSFDDAASGEIAVAAAGAAPHLGMAIGSGAFSCIGWPSPRLTPPFLANACATGPCAPPLLIVGGTHDAATPFETAQQVVAELANGSHLLRYDGHQHTYFAANADPCVGQEARAYLIDPSGYLPPISGACP